MSLTTREVADLLHVSTTTVTRTYAATRIPAAKVGRQWLFEREDVCVGPVATIEEAAVELA